MSKFGGITLTWLGHATLHFKTAQGTSVIVDPWIEGNPKFPDSWKNFDKLDVMLLTHGHSDHTGAALSLAQKHDPQIACVVELGDILGSQGANEKNIVGFNLGGTVRIADLEISMVEARHSSSVVIDGKPVYAGSPAGFIVKPDGGPTIYFAGDTSLFTDMKLIKELYAPEIAVLCIGDFYTMGPQHAAIAAEWTGVKKVVPVHWGTFPALKGRPAQLQQSLAGKGIEVVELEIGKATE